MHIRVSKILYFFPLGLFFNGIDHFEQIVLVLAQLRGIFDKIVIFLIIVGGDNGVGKPIFLIVVGIVDTLFAIYCL